MTGVPTKAVNKIRPAANLRLRVFISSHPLSSTHPAALGKEQQKWLLKLRLSKRIRIRQLSSQSQKHRKQAKYVHFLRLSFRLESRYVKNHSKSTEIYRRHLLVDFDFLF